MNSALTIILPARRIHALAVIDSERAAGREHYVYALAVGRHPPFYVGKGTGDRVWTSSTPTNPSNSKNALKRSILEKGGVRRFLLGTFATREQAFAFEYAEIERLLNQGVWLINRVVSLSDARALPVLPEPAREHRKRQGAVIRAGMSAEVRARLSAANRERWEDPEFREKFAASRRDLSEKWKDPEFRERCAAKLRARWAERRADPDQMAAMSAKLRAGHAACLADPERATRRRANHSAASKRVAASKASA